MKRYKKIIYCIIVSMIGQFIVLCYLDKVILKESDEFSIQNVDVTAQNISTDVDIPKDAEDIQVSYNGKYIKYLLDNKMMLLNTSTGESKEILVDTNILNSTWVPNNNTIFVVEKADNKVNVKTYNAVNGVEQDVCELCTYRKNIKIKSYISISAEYICVTSQGSTTIYRVNIDKEKKRLDKKVSSLESADVFWNKDVFFYQDSLTKKIYRYTNGESKRLTLDNQSKDIILKASGDMIYIGEYSETKKVSKIIYGEDQADTSKWKTEVLKRAVAPKDIYISENNEIFVNNKEEGKVENITTGKSISYEGSFISINDRVVCSLEDNEIHLKSIKDSE